MYRCYFGSVQISLCAEQLRHQDRTARRAAQGIVGEADKLDVILRIRTQTADGDRHAVLQVAVQAGLRAVVLAEVVQELLGCARQLELLGNALVRLPTMDDFLEFDLLLIGDKHRCGVAVGDRYAQALRGDARGGGVYDLAVLHMAPDLEGFLLGLFLFAADVGMTLSRLSGQVLKVFPAPEMAW